MPLPWRSKSPRLCCLFALAFPISMLCTLNTLFIASPRCARLLSSDVFKLVKSGVGVEKQHHGYISHTHCEQTLHLSTPPPRRGTNHLAEEYATAMHSQFGTGFMDFSWPDKAFLDVDYGHTSFPTSHCPSRSSTLKESEPEIFLSTMLTVTSQS